MPRLTASLTALALALGLAGTDARATAPPEAILPDLPILQDLLVRPIPGAGAAPRAVGHGDLVDEQALLGPAAASPRTSPGPAALALLGATTGPTVEREVLGYLPYWSYSASSPYVPARWDLLTILAWFNVEIDADGDITDGHGWGGATTAQIVADAHAHGVKVVVTVTNFSGSAIQALLGSATRRAHAIATLLDVIAMHGADGVNIDFEFVPLAARDDFVSFMGALKQAVAAVAPNGGAGHVSLAGPSVDWSGAYDYDALLAATDGIMVMAYGYHWSGGSPGPTSPLYGGAPWSKYAIDWTIEDYLTYGGVENRHKIIIGLPWYGRSWPVPNTDTPTTALGSGDTIVFRAAEAEVDSYGRQFDEPTRSTYYHKTVGGQLRQVWCDDYRSFKEKLAYVDAMDLGGVGIWALGYEGAYPDLWNAIEEVLGGAPVGPAEPGPEPGPEAVAELEPEPVAEPVVVEDTAPDVVEATDTAAAADTGTPSDAALGADTGGTGEHLPPGLVVGAARRDVHANTLIDEGGCTSGAPAGGLVAIAVAAWGLIRTRRRARALWPRVACRSWPYSRAAVCAPVTTLRAIRPQRECPRRAPV